MTKKQFHSFDPYAMLEHLNEQIKLLSSNCLNLAQAHNISQNQIDILTHRANEQQQEILDLRGDLSQLLDIINNLDLD